jgi:hypothetical protein
VLAQLVRVGETALRPAYAGLRDPWLPGWDRVAVACLVAAVVCAWVALGRRRIGTTALVLGGLCWPALLGIGLAALAPGGSYLAALPALAGGLAVLARHWTARAAAGVVAVVVLVPTAVLFFPALGLAVAAVPAFVLALLGLTLVPVLDELPAPRWVPAVALAAALVTGGIGYARNAPDPTRPTPTQLMYLLDADAGTARWVSAETDPGPWTRQYVTGREQVDLLGVTSEAATGPATAAPLAPPTVAVNGDGTVRVTPQRSVRLVVLETRGAAVRSASVDGTPVPVRDGRLRLVFHAPPPAGLELRLDLTGPASLQVTDGSDGLDGLPGFAPRPPDVGIAGSHTSELVAVTTRVDL